jgi:DNA-binding XRE family transcriptional regulator
MNAEEVGDRLRIARDNAKKTQTEAARAIDVARTTLVAIEQGQILGALPHRIFIEEAVMIQLEQGRQRGKENAGLTDRLITRGLIELVKLGPEGHRHFEDLAIGKAADALDDGEAATIACALETKGIPVVDERKAHRLCAEKYAMLKMACTVDLFAHPSVQEQLGRDTLITAILLALDIARMSVLPHRLDWIVDMIRARQSLDL